jgi:hypothetical protein
LGAQEQLGGQGEVGAALGHEIQNPSLAFGERRQRVVHTLAAQETSDEFWIQYAVAVRDPPHIARERLQVGDPVLEQVTDTGLEFGHQLHGVGRFDVLGQQQPDVGVCAPKLDRGERYDVRPHRPGTKHFHHPQVGDLTLGYQSMQLDGTPGHRLVAYYADVASPDHDAMVLLDMLGNQQTPDSADQNTGWA